MKRRPCQYCTRPLEWYAPLILFRTCRGCATRLSMGGFPMRPPAPPALPVDADTAPTSPSGAEPSTPTPTG